MRREFVAAMEDVLAGYAAPYEPTRPQVNCAETSKPLIKETSHPLPAQPGKPQRFDYAYARHGTRKLLLFVAPQAGRRHVHVTEQRPKLDLASERPGWVDKCSPAAEVIRVVLDHLNPHKIASLYEAFAPAEARRIARKLELHYPPKPGSWWNRAAIELSVVQRQCLEHRLPDANTLQRAIAAWEHPRHAEQAPIDWRFSVTDARQTLERLYP